MPNPRRRKRATDRGAAPNRDRAAPAMVSRAVGLGDELWRFLLLPLLFVSNIACWLSHVVRVCIKGGITAFFSILGMMFISRLLFALAQVLLYPLKGN